MKTLVTIWTLSMCIVLGACGKNVEKSADKATPAQTTKEAAPSPKGEGHADHDVVPGSHEDWCDEHGVPESQCTQCDPQLAAAFKATGDWCPEHGVPESQCKKCNPDLVIERPAKK